MKWSPQVWYTSVTVHSYYNIIDSIPCYHLPQPPSPCFLLATINLICFWVCFCFIYLFIYIPHRSETIQCLSLISLGTVPSRSIHVIANSKITCFYLRELRKGFSLRTIANIYRTFIKCQVVLSGFHPSFDSHNNLLRTVLLFLPFYRWRNKHRDVK